MSFKSAAAWFEFYADSPLTIAGKFRPEAIPKIAARMDAELGEDASDASRAAWAADFLDDYPLHRRDRKLPPNFRKFTPAQKLAWANGDDSNPSTNPRGIKVPAPLHPAMLGRGGCLVTKDKSND